MVNKCFMYSYQWTKCLLNRKWLLIEVHRFFAFDFFFFFQLNAAMQQRLYSCFWFVFIDIFTLLSNQRERLSTSHFDMFVFYHSLKSWTLFLLKTTVYCQHRWIFQKKSFVKDKKNLFESSYFFPLFFFQIKKNIKLILLT